MLTSTPAIVLHAFKYGESSKIVRLMTRDLGLQSAVAKGAMRPKSKFGARLELFSEGVAQIYTKPGRELQTLGEFDLIRQHVALAHDLDRFGYAEVLAELLIKCSPADPHPEIFCVLSDSLAALTRAGQATVQATGVSIVWRVVSELGFAPVVEHCAVDGREIGDGDAAFSYSDGGFVCAGCAGRRHVSRLSSADRLLVVRSLTGSPVEGVELDAATAAAHRRLIARFVRHHLSEGRNMKALDLWE
ncbi:MAG: DNA repair protein RecO [Gemmatimonadales bacterium]